MTRLGKCGGCTPNVRNPSDLVASSREHNEGARSLPLLVRTEVAAASCTVPKSIRRHDLALHMFFADLVAQSMIVSRADEAGKKRVRRQGLRFQFGVRLSAQEPGMVGELDHLDEFPVGRFARKDESGLRHAVFEGRVEFVAVAMALGDGVRFVDTFGE